MNTFLVNQYLEQIFNAICTGVGQMNQVLSTDNTLRINGARRDFCVGASGLLQELGLMK